VPRVARPPEARPTRPWPQPERLGKYDIVEVLGKGAMGVVFKGFDPDIDRTVAI
jgi:hypothetical protein